MTTLYLGEQMRAATRSARHNGSLPVSCITGDNQDPLHSMSRLVVGKYEKYCSTLGLWYLPAITVVTKQFMYSVYEAQVYEVWTINVQRQPATCKPDSKRRVSTLFAIKHVTIRLSNLANSFSDQILHKQGDQLPGTICPC